MEIEFLTRKSLEENLSGIITLYEECFNRGLDINSFKWRYLDNPFDEILYVVARDNNQIVASYSASPTYLNYKGKKIKSAISINTMTHPKYQGRGLFVKLAKLLYEHMGKNGYSMIWGFPNNLSNRTFNDRLGWKTIYEIPTMTFMLEDFSPQVVELNITEDIKFGLNYSNFKKNNNQKIHVIKDEKYFKWRYLNNPDNEYTQVVYTPNGIATSYAIYKEYKNIINIVDINYRDANEIKDIINSILNYGFMKGKDSVTIWAPINTELHSILEKMNFYNDYPVRYFGGKVLSESPDSKKMLTYDNWIINAGDNNEY